MLKDKMKQDTDWVTASTSYDPLTLYRLIKKTILAQTEDQYPFATVYEQELGFYSFRQERLTNAQWYERFNTKVDVGQAIGVTRVHKVLLEWVAQDEHNQPFSSMTDAEQDAVRTDAEERYLSYVFLRQSGTQHAYLRDSLKDVFTTGDNKYPKNRQQTLHLLDKYSKKVEAKTTDSEGTAFAQNGGKGTGKGKGKDNSAKFDQEYWKDKKCHNCGKKGHPSRACQDDDGDDAKSTSQSSTSDKSIKKLNKDMKSMKKQFTQVNTQLQQLKEDDSDLSDSETEEDSHFQIGLQFTQIDNDVDDDLNSPPLMECYSSDEEDELPPPRLVRSKTQACVAQSRNKLSATYCTIV